MKPPVCASRPNVRVSRRKRVSSFWLAPVCPCCDQIGQALRDDLPRLFDQLAHNLPGRFNLSDQTNGLTCQQVHRLDIPARITIRRESHEAQHRHGLPADDGLADHRLVRAGFLTTSLLTEPLPHERGPQSSVRGVRPAVTEQGGSNRVRLLAARRSQTARSQVRRLQMGLVMFS